MRGKAAIVASYVDPVLDKATRPAPKFNVLKNKVESGGLDFIPTDIYFLSNTDHGRKNYLYWEIPGASKPKIWKIRMWLQPLSSHYPPIYILIFGDIGGCKMTCQVTPSICTAAAIGAFSPVFVVFGLPM